MPKFDKILEMPEDTLLINEEQIDDYIKQKAKETKKGGGMTMGGGGNNAVEEKSKEPQVVQIEK